MPYELVWAHARIKPTCSQFVVLIIITQSYVKLITYVFMNVVHEMEIIFSALRHVRILIAVLFPVHAFPVRKKNVITIENSLSWKCGFHFT